MVENDRTVVIDASTAHRTDPAFAYGFPELGEAFAEKIKTAKRIAVRDVMPAALSRWFIRLFSRGFCRAGRCSVFIR